MTGFVELAAWELRAALRSRWVIGTAAVFAAACLAAAFFGLRSLRALGLGGAGAATEALINVGVLLPPLLALLLGAGSLAGARERGFLALLGAQPVSWTAVVTGTLGGVVATVSLAVVGGYGLAAVVAGGSAQAADVTAFAGLLGATLSAVVAAGAVGVALSAVSANRLQATAAAVTVWFLLAFGVDVLTATVAPTLALGPAGLLVVVLANPLEAARMLALLGAAPEGAALGPFGTWLASRFGPAGGAGLFVGALGFWTLAPLAVATQALRWKDQ